MFIDLHEDIAHYFLTSLSPQPFDVDAEWRQSDLPKLRRAGAELVVAAVFPFVNSYSGWSPSLQLALEGFKVYYALSETHGIKIVERRGDLAAPGLKFLIVLEGADVLSSADDLRLFYRLGLRALGLTWNLSNRWGGSCCGGRDRGLSEEGYGLVETAQRMGVLVDLAHAGERTALDVLEAARRPVVVSHANAVAVYSHRRNVGDEVLKKLRDVGGVIGLTFIPSTISSDPTPRDLAKHARYIRDKFGVEILAIGTDYLGISTTPQGLESVDKIPRLAEALIEAGFRREEVEAVMWRNAARVLREVLP
ncbi:peptidase M19, renal dipeptidase [Pyrobaculum islandicum DSM 4184]|uniref:Peptidase M19, renal dipeptidase n=1 Tax=Pyrobaculum islandicum (strain DSM 4184 / JCM 9189 / GEO3) TaxID=384616 RepID=A1RQI4_PYRIL|nr:dipeptidase [Pyrobaculum islandicum]ABL87216.1 peptidase M19, renal dipeptidase [Pyrobaculum islandicum DSM 4184]